MQPRPLQIIDILKFAAIAHGGVEIVSRLIDEPIARSTYAAELKRVEPPKLISVLPRTMSPLALSMSVLLPTVFWMPP